MEPRFKVINDVLEIENRLSKLLLIVFRILNDNTNTLGHKSSSLSSRNKIDLLWDLGELSKLEYEQLKVILEIRNQFAHNLICKSFLDLKEMNNHLTNNLIKFFPTNIVDDEDTYLRLFTQLFESCISKLQTLHESYLAGLFLESKKYVAFHVLEDMDQIINNAKNLWQEQSGISVENNYHIGGFILSLHACISRKEADIHSLISGKREIVFDKKSDINSLKEEFRIIDERIAAANDKSD